MIVDNITIRQTSHIHEINASHKIGESKHVNSKLLGTRVFIINRVVDDIHYILFTNSPLGRFLV